MDNKLFKNFIDKINKILAFKKTVPSPLLLLLLLLSSSSFDYKLELELKLLLAICVRSLLYLPT